MKEPLASTYPGFLGTSSQIINNLEIASAKLTTLPADKTKMEAPPVNKDLEEELLSHTNVDVPAAMLRPDVSTGKTFPWNYRRIALLVF